MRCEAVFYFDFGGRWRTYGSAIERFGFRRRRKRKSPRGMDVDPRLFENVVCFLSRHFLFLRCGGFWIWE